MLPNREKKRNRERKRDKKRREKLMAGGPEKEFMREMAMELRCGE